VATDSSSRLLRLVLVALFDQLVLVCDLHDRLFARATDYGNERRLVKQSNRYNPGTAMTASTRNLWLIFAIAQAAGIASSFATNIHSNPAPLVFAIFLCFPGSLLVSLVPPNTPFALQCVFMFTVNAVIWWVVSKLATKEKPSRLGSQG